MAADWTCLETAKLAASLASPIVTVVGFWFVWKQLKNTNLQIEIAGQGLDASNLQNKKNQDWKRAEFIAGEIKEFYKDPTVVKVLQMIDYTDRRYDIGSKDKNGAPRLTRITHSQAAANKLREDSVVAIETALRTAEEYSSEEAIIRDYFDTFLYYGGAVRKIPQGSSDQRERDFSVSSILYTDLSRTTGPCRPRNAQVVSNISPRLSL